MAMAIKCCERCSTNYLLKASPANISKQKYCSRDCRNKAAKESIPIWEDSMRSRLSKRQAKRDTGCIEYTGQRGVYGHIEYRRKTYLTHRVSWILERGPIPDGMLVCHKCDNPLCINIEHLFLGTYKDNTQDMLKKGRGNWDHMRGDKHHSHRPRALRQRT